MSSIIIGSVSSAVKKSTTLSNFAFFANFAVRSRHSINKPKFRLGEPPRSQSSLTIRIAKVRVANISCSLAAGTSFGTWILKLFASSVLEAYKAGFALLSQEVRKLVERFCK